MISGLQLDYRPVNCRLSHSDIVGMNKINFLAALLSITVSPNIFAANEIVDVRRNITLSNDEEPIKDFYIKISEGAGFKKNLVVKATRKISVKDSSLKAVGDFKTVVGLLKIIHTEDAVAVAREFKLIPRADQPLLEQIGIMSGDEIDLTDSFTDTTKPAEPKKKVASAKAPVTDTYPAQDAERIPAAAVPGASAPVISPTTIKPGSVSTDI